MTTAEKYILMGNLSMKDGRYEQAIISYRCAVLSGDWGNRSFALARSAKCYCILKKYEKVLELYEKMPEKFGPDILSKAFVEHCAEAADALGMSEKAAELREHGIAIEREKAIKSSATSTVRKSEKSRSRSLSRAGAPGADESDESDESDEAGESDEVGDAGDTGELDSAGKLKTVGAADN